MHGCIGYLAIPMALSSSRSPEDIDTKQTLERDYRRNGTVLLSFLILIGHMINSTTYYLNLFFLSQFDSLESVNCKVNAAALKVHKDVIARREAPHGER